MKRTTHFKLKQKKLVNYRIFTEGVIFLMKRKTKTGIKMISQLIERMPTTSKDDSDDNEAGQSDFIQNLMFTYRAYANFVLEDYDLCIKDYLKAN